MSEPADQWIEAVKWFCRDFNLSDDDIHNLSAALEAAKDDPRQGAKVVEGFLSAQLEEWQIGKKLVIDCRNQTGTVKQRAALLSRKINHYQYLQHHQNSARRNQKLLPYIVISRGAVACDCPDHAHLWDQVFHVEELDYLDKPLGSEWTCFCRLRNMTEQSKDRFEEAK